MTEAQAPQIVNPQGQPVRSAQAEGRCPRCGAGRDKRAPSQTFGPPTDVCGECHFTFAEFTCG